MLKINSKKTKVMVFQKGKYKCDYVFHIGNEIFDTMISPILTYRNSELWSAFVKSDFKSWDNSGIEKTHLHFCKLCYAKRDKISKMQLYNSNPPIHYQDR